MFVTVNKNTKLPLEYPKATGFNIYKRRFLVMFAIAGGNFVFLGFLLLMASIEKNLFYNTLIASGLSILVIMLIRIVGRSFLFMRIKSELIAFRSFRQSEMKYRTTIKKLIFEKNQNKIAYNISRMMNEERIQMIDKTVEQNQ